MRKESISAQAEMMRRDIHGHVKQCESILRNIMADFESHIEKLVECDGTEQAQFTAKQVALGARTMFDALARLIAFSERLVNSLEHDEGIPAFVELLNAQYSEEKKIVFKKNIKTSIEPKTGLINTASPGALDPQYFYLEPMSLRDIFQGVGYDQVCEEGGCLSSLFWQGNNERSPNHPHVRSLLTDWLGRSESQNRVLRVLDIGTGSCTSILNLLPQLPLGTKYYACDICTDILKLGIRRLKQKNLVVNIVICDAQDLPYADESFDLVFNFGSLCQMPDQQRALNEMWRVLNLNGLCICRDEYFVPKENTLPPLKAEWFTTFWEKGTKPNVEFLPRGATASNLKMINEVHFVWSFEKKS